MDERFHGFCCGPLLAAEPPQTFPSRLARIDLDSSLFFAFERAPEVGKHHQIVLLFSNEILHPPPPTTTPDPCFFDWCACVCWWDFRVSLSIGHLSALEKSGSVIISGSSGIYLYAHKGQLSAYMNMSSDHSVFGAPRIVYDGSGCQQHGRLFVQGPGHSACEVANISVSCYYFVDCSVEIGDVHHSRPSPLTDADSGARIVIFSPVGTYPFSGRQRGWVTMIYSSFRWRTGIAPTV